MNARHFALASLTLLAIPSLDAQNNTPESSQDPVQAAIRQFNERRAGKSNEVTVVLDPVGTPPAPVAKDAPPEPAPAKPGKSAKLVESAAPSRSPAPAATSRIDKTPDNAPQATVPPAQTPSAEPAPTPRPGLAVRVEKLQVGTGTIDASQVKLLAPFPAKPLMPAPAGWSLQASTSAPPFTREVELSPGNTITLTIHPHLLVPDADGAAVFSVPEPGFDSTLSYRQSATVGAILSHSIRQLDDDAKELGTTIDKLQQILVSLPKSSPAEPAPTAQPVPAEALKPSPTRKR